MEAIRVLLVEDEPSTRLLFRDCLEGMEGVEVCGEAADGAQGLALILAEAPDLVLLDLVMDGMDGLALLRALRRTPPPKPPKIIVVSHMVNEDIVRRGRDLGVSYYMLKPVDCSQLAENIYLFCAREQAEAGPEAGRARWLLQRMGAPQDSLGARYAALTAQALAGDEAGDMLLKQAYGPAMREGRTDREHVEKNIRDLIERLHAQGEEAYIRLMGGLPPRRPDNRTFLKALAAAVRLEERRGERS